MVDNILNNIIKQNKKLNIQFQRVICPLLPIAYCKSITKFKVISFLKVWKLQFYSVGTRNTSTRSYTFNKNRLWKYLYLTRLRDIGEVINERVGCSAAKTTGAAVAMPLKRAHLVLFHRPRRPPLSRSLYYVLIMCKTNYIKFRSYNT